MKKSHKPAKRTAGELGHTIIKTAQLEYYKEFIPVHGLTHMNTYLYYGIVEQIY